MMVEGMYEKTTAREVVGEGASDRAGHRAGGEKPTEDTVSCI